MKAIVLCAGMGTRLRPLTDAIPKPLIEITGFVLLHDILLHLAQLGVTEAVVNGSWKAEMIKDFMEVSDLPLETAFQLEEQPLGTAGAVRRALPLLGDEFLVVYGDNLTRQPLEPLFEVHNKVNSEITIALSPTGDPSSKGIVITGPDGIISRFREKPPPELAESNMANSGIYICRSSAVSHIEDGSFSDFGLDVFPELLREGRILAADTPGGYTRDIGSLKSYLIACHEVLSGQVKPYVKPSCIKNGILIENSQSYEKIEIMGTLWVQEGATIESGCCLENCVVLSGAKVRHNSALKNTLVLPDSDVDEGTRATDKYLSIF